jgi:hypothetical protein
MPMWVLRVAFALIGTLASLHVQAQDHASTPLYEDVLAEAMRAYQARDWALACEQFERAHELYPNARALRGIGVAAFESGWYVRAVHALEGALVHPERPLSAELREVTELLASQARARVGTYRVVRSPEHATLFVNDLPATLEPDGTLLLDAGMHTLRLEALEFVSKRRSIQVRGGEHEDLALTLAPVPSEPLEPRASTPIVSPLPSLLAPSESEASPPRGPRKVDAMSPGSRARRIGGWSAIGVGGAALVSVGALWGTGRARLADISEDCRSMADGCEESDAQSRLRDAELKRLERGINASIAIGVTALATATVLFSVELFGKRKKPSKLRARGLSLAF